MVSPQFVSPYGLILIRVSMAVILFWSFAFLFVKTEKIDRGDFLRLFLCAIFGTSCNMLLFFKGISLTTPTNCALIMTMTPILVFIIAVLSRSEKVSRTKFIGLALAFVGSIWLFKTSLSHLETSRLLGDSLILINAVLYGIYIVIVKPLSTKYHPFTLFKWLFFIGFFVVLPFGYNEFQQVSWNILPIISYWHILYIGIGATFLTYLFNVIALKNTSPSVVGAYIYLQPLLASIIGVSLGQDVFEIEKIGITLLIIGGVYLVSRKQPYPKTK